MTTPTKDKPYSINLWAPTGVGKSTTMAALFALLKHRGERVEMAPEFAKDIVYEENKAALSDPFYLMASHEYRRSRLIGQVRYIITDSPPEMAAVYSEGREEVWALRDLAEHFRRRYRNIDVRLVRDERRPFQTYGRLHTLEESKKMDQQVDRLLAYVATHSVPHIRADAGAAAKILSWMDSEGY